MKTNKKEYPLILHHALAPYLNVMNELFERVDNASDLIRFKDKDPYSNFYFHVYSYSVSQGELILYVDYKPSNESTVQNTKVAISSSSLQNYLDNWSSLIKQYNNVQTVFDDPIIEQYQKEYEEAEILEEDAAYSYFNQSQQLFLEEYLDKVVKSISAYDIPVGNENDAKILMDEVNNLKQNLTKKTKKETVQSLNKIWARARKIGLELIRDVFINVASTFIQQGLFSFGSHYLI